MSKTSGAERECRELLANCGVEAIVQLRTENDELRAEIERLRMDVETLSQGIANREKAKQMFQSQVTMVVACLKKVYRKHAMSDESIGWDEVEDQIGNTLCELIGDGNFSNWVERF